jgi:hypothetical protein
LILVYHVSLADLDDERWIYCPLPRIPSIEMQSAEIFYLCSEDSVEYSSVWNLQVEALGSSKDTKIEKRCKAGKKGSSDIFLCMPYGCAVKESWGI